MYSHGCRVLCPEISVCVRVCECVCVRVVVCSQTCHRQVLHPYNTEEAEQHRTVCRARHDKLQARLRSADIECCICMEKVRQRRGLTKPHLTNACPRECTHDSFAVRASSLCCVLVYAAPAMGVCTLRLCVGE